MQALGGPAGELMRDVRAVEWMALEEAIERLSHAREQAFLAHVGPVALKAAERALRRVTERTPRRRPAPRPRVAPIIEPVDTSPWLAPVDLAVPSPVDSAPITMPAELARPFELVQSVEPARPAASAVTLPPSPIRPVSAYAPDADDGQGILERTWGWVRQVAQAQRPRRA
jgi:8-oxo-dGTP diphosphatase